MFANTPAPPYYAVIFTSIRTNGDNGYNEMAGKMAKLAASQPGFLGLESARNELGITVSYWQNLEAIKNWREHFEHTQARNKGRETWYAAFRVRICKVEREYGFGA